MKGISEDVFIKLCEELHNAIIDYLNQLKDSNGNQYNFELKCWSDYGIDVNSLLTDE